MAAANDKGPSTNGSPSNGQEAAHLSSAIHVEDLFYSYKNCQALRGVTFSIARRSIHGFVGPNGAGKTTALKILSTLLKPHSGRLNMMGLDVVRDYKKVRPRIGFMPDHFSVYRQMTVFEYLDFFAAAYGMDVARRNQVIGDILRLTDMEGRQHDFLHALSRGMQQRVGLARVLVNDPDILLLDEPASGLDPRARIELMEILKELRRMGKTIFISSHILSELATLCDSFTIIDRGKVKYTGPKRGLLSKDGQTRTYMLTLAHPHPPAGKALEALEGVVGIEHLEEESTYRVTLDMEKAAPNALLRAILESEGQIASLQEDSAQLNQAFMDLTEPGVPT